MPKKPHISMFVRTGLFTIQVCLSVYKQSIRNRFVFGYNLVTGCLGVLRGLFQEGPIANAILKNRWRRLMILFSAKFC